MTEPFDEDLLELRVHGIRNTPPHVMLETRADNLCVCRGDSLAGFSVRRRSTGRHRVEAYSWGGLARFTGLPTVGRAADTVVRVIWLFLAPFGMTNAAYWSRHQLGTEASEKLDKGVSGVTDNVVGRGRGAGTARVLGLFLTLFFVSVVALVCLELVPAATWGPVLWFLPDDPEVPAPTVLAVVPVLALVVLWVLPVLARTRYVPGTWRPPATEGAEAAPGPEVPVLAHRDFWRVGAGMGYLNLVHVGGGLAWIGAIIATCSLIRADEAGWVVWSWSGFSPVVLVALIGVLWSVWCVNRPGVRVPGTRLGAHEWSVFGVGVLAWVAATWVMSWSGGVPANTRAGDLAVVVVSVFLVLLLVLLLWHAMRSRGSDPANSDPQNLGWDGQGPFVFGCLAVAFALVLSLAVVRGAVWALRMAEPPIVVTLFGIGFAGLTVGIIGLFLVTWFFVWIRADDDLGDIKKGFERGTGLWAYAADREAAATSIRRSRRWASYFRRAELFAWWMAYIAFFSLTLGVVLSALWLAGRLSRDEMALMNWPLNWGSFGLWSAVALVVVLVALSSIKESRPVALLWDLMCFLPTQAHPFGPPCYTERVAPEMADRIEDWLSGQDPPCASCLGEDCRCQPRAPTDTGSRRVVVAAHSMGLVLVLSALFHLHARGATTSVLQRISLVSYGVQVRRYFSRFFPQVFGPQILSIVPAPRPKVTQPHPWPPSVAGEEETERASNRFHQPHSAGARPVSLRTILGDRWVNLYRANDPLGFPVRYVTRLPAETMDRSAEEFDPTAYQFTVAAHNLYLPTAAYRKAVSDLASQLGPAAVTANPASSHPSS